MQAAADPQISPPNRSRGPSDRALRNGVSVGFGGVCGYALWAKEAGSPPRGQRSWGWMAGSARRAVLREEKKMRARELLTAHTLDDRFLSETRKVKQHSAVMKRSKRAALNYHFSQCCRDWLRAQGKITSKLSHAAELPREKCWSVQGLAELSSHFYLILKTAKASNLRIQPKCLKCIFLAVSRGQR